MDKTKTRSESGFESRFELESILESRPRIQTDRAYEQFPYGNNAMSPFGTHLIHRFTDEQLAPIWEEVNKIKSDFDAYKHDDYRYTLAGNIEHEYKLRECHDYVWKLVEPIALDYNEASNVLNRRSYNMNPHKIDLENLWVNYQQKYDFNPPHNHAGVLSFVIWLQIPYDINDEVNQPRSVKARNQMAGHFSFSYTNPFGEIVFDNIPVDKHFSGCMAIFPSELIHSVYPFYTSDDYRITVSGNIKYNEKMEEWVYGGIPRQHK
jgi:hypothetical protein